jgi:hypothetical protein
MNSTAKLKSIVVGIAGLVVTLPLVAALYMTGLVNTLGVAAASESYGGGFTSDTAEFSLGLSRFYFLEGQEVYFDYDVTVDNGAMRFGLMHIGALANGLHDYKDVYRSGTGTVSFRVRESGFYRTYFNGWPGARKKKKRGYEVSYNVTWGVR